MIYDYMCFGGGVGGVRLIWEVMLAAFNKINDCNMYLISRDGRKWAICLCENYIHNI